MRKNVLEWGMTVRLLKITLQVQTVPATSMATKLQVKGRVKTSRVLAAFDEDFITRTQASLIQAGVYKSTLVLDYKFSDDQL